MPSVRVFYEALPCVLRHGGDPAMERIMKAIRVCALLAAALGVSGVHRFAYPQDAHAGKATFVSLLAV